MLNRLVHRLTFGEETMSDTRSRYGVLVSLAAAVGAFGAAAMMSAATAPTARADDFTDVTNAIDGDFTIGQTYLGLAGAYLEISDVKDSLASFFTGVDDESVGAPNNLEIGSLDLLANEPVIGSLDSFAVPPETDFTSALAFAETLLGDSEGYSTSAATELFSGNYVGAAYDDYLVSLYDVASLQVLFEGAVASF
jgi:hypothetical protein